MWDGANESVKKKVGGIPNGKIFYCADYNDGNCPFEDHHKGVFNKKQLMMYHVCRSCLKLENHPRKFHPAGDPTCPCDVKRLDFTRGEGNIQSVVVNSFWIDNHDKKSISSGKHNADGCRVEVPTPWNLELFEQLLQGYEDQEILRYMEYGWPLEGDLFIMMLFQIIRRGQENPKEVRQYVQSEIDRGAVIGPFKENPFNANVRIFSL